MNGNKPIKLSPEVKENFIRAKTEIIGKTDDKLTNSQAVNVLVEVWNRHKGEIEKIEHEEVEEGEGDAEWKRRVLENET